MVTLDVVVASYGNGNRPTAEGAISGRQFFFRMDGTGDWAFGVQREGPSSDRWASFLSDDADLAYFASGGAGRGLFPDGALPFFLGAFADYLEHLGVDDSDGELVAWVRQQAEYHMNES